MDKQTKIQNVNMNLMNITGNNKESYSNVEFTQSYIGQTVPLGYSVSFNKNSAVKKGEREDAGEFTLNNLPANSNTNNAIGNNVLNNNVLSNNVFNNNVLNNQMNNLYNPIYNIYNGEELLSNFDSGSQIYNLYPHSLEYVTMPVPQSLSTPMMINPQQDPNVNNNLNTPNNNLNNPNNIKANSNLLMTPYRIAFGGMYDNNNSNALNHNYLLGNNYNYNYLDNINSNSNLKNCEANMLPYLNLRPNFQFNHKVAIKTITDDDYIYVNPKQYFRILYRREKRRKLNMKLTAKLLIKSQYPNIANISNMTNLKEIESLCASNAIHTNFKPKYIHESRHKHAMTRERGKGGRFLSKKANSSSSSIKQDEK